MSGQTILLLYVRGWVDAVSLLRRPVHVVPFLLVALLKLIPLLVVSFLSHPLIAGFSVPSVRTVFGEAAVHYPQHVVMLVDMYRAIDITVLLLFGFAMYGWAVLAMTDTLQGRPVRATGYGLHIVASLPSLLVIGVLFVLITFGIPVLLEHVTEPLRRPKLVQLLTFTAVALWVAAMSFLIYAFFFLGQAPFRPFEIIRRSIRFAAKRFAMTATTLLTVLALHALTNQLLSGLLTPHVGASDPFLQAIGLKLLSDTIVGYYLFAATTSLAVGAGKGRMT
jgi:hypothetical protein